MRNIRLDDISAVGIIGLAWIALIIAVQPLGNFPLNDDWVYGLAVKSVLEKGYYQFPSPSSANVGPLVYWGALFCLPGGFSFNALRIATLTLGFIGLFGMYSLIRTVGATPKLALLGALALAVNPLYLGLANSFMTDVPFLTVLILSLVLLIKSLQLESRAYLIGGLALAFCAILIRQLGIVLLIGFAFAYLTKYGYRLGNLAKTIAWVVAGVLLHFAYQYWLVETGRTPLLTLHSSADHLNFPTLTIIIKKFLIMLMYTGFFILPLVPVLWSRDAGLRSRKKAYWVAAFLLVVGFFLLLWWTDEFMPLADNVLLKSGLGPLTLLDTSNAQINYPAIPPALEYFWVAITFLSVVAGGLVLYYLLTSGYRYWLALKTSARTTTWLSVLLMATGVSYFAILTILAAGFPLFDRYYLVLLPLFVLLILITQGDSPHKSGSVNLSWGLLIFYAVFSVAATHDYLSWNRTRWMATSDLMQKDKISPKQIDGGYEFNGWYLYDAKYDHNPKKSWWWVVDDEYVIASGPVPGYRELRRYPFQRWLLQRVSYVYVLKKSRPAEHG